MPGAPYGGCPPPPYGCPPLPYGCCGAVAYGFGGWSGTWPGAGGCPGTWPPGAGGGVYGPGYGCCGGWAP